MMGHMCVARCIHIPTNLFLHGGPCGLPGPLFRCGSVCPLHAHRLPCRRHVLGRSLMQPGVPCVQGRLHRAAGLEGAAIVRGEAVHLPQEPLQLRLPRPQFLGGGCVLSGQPLHGLLLLLVVLLVEDGGGVVAGGECGGDVLTKACQVHQALRGRAVWFALGWLYRRTL